MKDKFLIGSVAGAATVPVSEVRPPQGSDGYLYFSCADFDRITVQVAVDGATPSSNVDLQGTNFDPADDVWTEIGNVDAVSTNGVIKVVDLCYRYARVVVSAVNAGADTCDVAIYLVS